MKEPKCKFCGQTGHYKFQCYQAPKKPIAKQPLKPILRRSKPLLATKTSTYPSKPKPISKTPKTRRKQLIKELDNVFSKYIRLKASSDGLAVCVTCGKIDSWKHMDNGHFLSRSKIGTRFSERNCHPQCRRCNRLLKGNLDRYQRYLKWRYGINIVDELKEEAKKSLKTYEIEAKIEYYKKMVLILK